MNMTTNNRDNIINRFVRNHAEVGERLKKLQEYHDNHFDSNPDNLNWGDVGSAVEINRLLKDILVFVGIEKEE